MIRKTTSGAASIINDGYQEFTGDGTVTDFVITDFVPGNRVKVTVEGSRYHSGFTFTKATNTVSFSTAPWDGWSILIEKL